MRLETALSIHLAFIVPQSHFCITRSCIKRHTEVATCARRQYCMKWMNVDNLATYTRESLLQKEEIVNCEAGKESKKKTLKSLMLFYSCFK